MFKDLGHPSEVRISTTLAVNNLPQRENPHYIKHAYKHKGSRTKEFLILTQNEPYTYLGIHLVLSLKY